MDKNIEKKFEQLIKNILIRAREKLRELKNEDFPYDFNSNVIHDLVHEEIDSLVAGFDRQECLEWIEFCNNEEYIDKGVIDNSSVDRMLITMAFECIRMKVFEDGLINDLQEYDLTKEKRDRLIRRINRRLRNTRYKVGEDNESQIFIEFDFELDVEDFKEPYFSKEQVIGLDDAIKIFACNQEINRNAIVIEKQHGNIYRVYLMDKDNDIDIRDFFRYVPSIKEANYNLSPQIYVDGKIKKRFDSKEELIGYISKMANMLIKKTKKEVSK